MRPFIRQGEKRNCGHIAVAVLTGASVEMVEELVGHSHGSRTRELREALLKLGFDAPLRRQVMRKWSFPKDAFGIIHIRENGYSSGGHFVALAEGYTYCGHQGRPLALSAFEHIAVLNGWRLTAFLPVWKTESWVR